MSPEQRRESRSVLVRRWSLRVGVLVVFAAAWEALAHTADSLLVPTFTGTLMALTRLVATPQLWSALWISNQAMVLGFFLAAVVGVSLGFLISRWPATEGLIDPYLSILLVTPMSAIIPIIIMATGLGLTSRVAVVFAFTFVTITINTRAGLRMIEPAWIEMPLAFGATESQLWRKVLLRGARPAILMGLRLGLIRAVSGMITMELLLVAVGLGRLILDYESQFDAANMYATVIVVIAEAVVLTQLCQALEVRASPWADRVATK